MAFGEGEVSVEGEISEAVGASAGAPFNVSPSIQIVPFGEAYFQRRVSRVSGSGITVTGFGSNGLYEVGIMLAANHRLAIGPVTRNVFGTPETSRRAYGVVTSFNFGR